MGHPSVGGGLSEGVSRFRAIAHLSDDKAVAKMVHPIGGGFCCGV